MEVVNEEESTEKDTVAQAIEQVKEISLRAEEISNPSVQQIRSSSRERSFTEKGLEMREQEAKKQEKAFYKTYNCWKESKRRVDRD